MKPALLLLSLVLVGCAARQTAPSHACDVDALRAELAGLRKQVDGIQNQLGHLESNVLANQVEGEFKEMTIDWVAAPGDRRFPGLAGVGGGGELVCHVVEWDGFGRMLRFTRMADPTFYLEAAGVATVEARMAEGGICDAKGGTRLTILSLNGRLTPEVEYRLRPRNESEKYRWIVKDDVTVLGTEAPRGGGRSSSVFNSQLRPETISSAGDHSKLLRLRR